MIYKLLSNQFLKNKDLNHKYTNIIPSYFYNNDNNSVKIFNKKLHTT